jgi:hypothetical protein
MATVAIDVSGVEELGDRLRGIGAAAPKAVLRAISRTRTTIMARMARIVAQGAGVPVRRVKRSIHGTKPSQADPNITLTLWGARAALIDYARGVQRGNMPPMAFRATMPGGHVGFFERRPGIASRKPMEGRAISKRVRPGVWHTLPIDEAYGPPLDSFLAGGQLEQLVREGGEVFRANLEREIAFREGQQVA